MSDFNYTGYNQRKRASLGGYGAKAAQNAYARFLSQQRGARKKFAMQQETEQQAPRLVSSFTKRNLAGPGVQSGIYQKGLQDFAKQKTQEMADFNFDLGAEQQQFDLTDAQNLADFQAEQAALDAEKQNDIASTAATLLAFKPFLGV